MTFTIGQNDTHPPIQSQLQTSNNVLVNMEGVNQISFRMENVETKELVVSDNLEGRVVISDEDLATVEYQWREQDTEQVGRYKAEWFVEYVDGSTESFPNRGKIDVRISESVE